MKVKKIIVFILAFAFLLVACYSYLYSNAKHVNQNSEKEIASADLIQKDDSIIYRIGNKYFINKGNEVKALDMEKASLESTRKNQFFLTEDNQKILYNTDFPDTEGRIMIYDIKLDKKVDLLRELHINIDGYISVFAYKSNKIIAVIGHSEKDKKTGGITSKTETDRLVEIDLKDGTYRFIKLPFTPCGISAYQGIAFYNEGYLLCQSGYQNDKNWNQSIVIVDKSGNVVNVLPLYDEKVIYSIKVSPDNRFISYQTGQTPTDLNIYDIKKNKKTNIHDSTKEKSGFCSYDIWSNDGNTLYYILAIDEVDKQSTLVTNYYINRFDIKSMAVEYSKQIPSE